MSRTVRRRLQVIAVSFLSVSLQTASAEAAVIRNGATLEVSGSLSSNLLIELRRTPWELVRLVRLTSAGGLPTDALDIAHLLASTGKPIELHDLCASGCIDVLAIRGRVTVAPGTVLMFHNTPAGQGEITALRYPQVSRALDDMGQAQRAWFTQNGVSPALVILAQAALIPVCVYAPASPTLDLSKLVTATRYSAWAPTGVELRKLGFDLRGSWMQDAAGVRRLMAEKFPQAKPELLRIDATDKALQTSESAALENLRRTPVCPASLLAAGGVPRPSTSR